MPGYIEDADLPAVYGGALAFVFPSLYEGFGLPPLEAMACGTPVLSSNASSLPAVCGDAARLFSPHDEEQMFDALRPVLANSGERHDMRRRGLIQAARFAWERAAEETWALYQRIVGGGWA